MATQQEPRSWITCCAYPTWERPAGRQRLMTWQLSHETKRRHRQNGRRPPAGGVRQFCGDWPVAWLACWSGCACLSVRVVADGFPGSAGLAAAEGDDRVGSGDGPVHAGLLESLSDDGFAAGLDEAGADEQAAGAEPAVAHAGRVGEEVAEFSAYLVFLDSFERVAADGCLDAVDVAVVEVFQAGGEPLVPVVEQHELQGPGQGVQVLAGVVEVDDLSGLGELAGGDVPDPGSPVPEDGELADVVRAAADALGLHEVPERGGGLERRDHSGRVPGPDPVPPGVQPVLGEEDRELDLAGAGPAVLAFSLPARGLAARPRDARSVPGGAELR